MTVALLLHRADGAPPSTSFRKAAFGPADPFARNREIAWEGPDSMSAGRVSFIGELDVASFPHIETIVVVEGELTPDRGRRRPAGARPQARRRHRLRHGASHPGRIAQRGSCSARPLASKPTKRGITPLRADAELQAVQLAAGRGAAGPGPAMPQRQRLHRRRRGVPRGHLGFDTLPPHRSPASPQRVHVSCWPAACGSQPPMAACCRRAPAMRCSCRRAHRSDGKAAIAWRSSTCAKASRPEATNEIQPCPSHCASSRLRPTRRPVPTSS